MPRCKQRGETYLHLCHRFSLRQRSPNIALLRGFDCETLHDRSRAGRSHDTRKHCGWQQTNMFGTKMTRTKDPTRPHLRVALDRPLDVHTIAIACIAVPYAWYVSQGGANIGGGGQHFGVRQELQSNAAESHCITHTHAGRIGGDVSMSLPTTVGLHASPTAVDDRLKTMRRKHERTQSAPADWHRLTPASSLIVIL